MPAIPPIRNILVPTDFSEESAHAFAHALRLAMAFKAELDIFHVEPKNDQADWHWAPSVLKTLIAWKYLPAGATEADVEALGIHVRQSTGAGLKAEDAILQEMANSHADLVVMATHGRSGIARWIQPSVTAPIAVRGAVPVLLLPPQARGFVDKDGGGAAIERVVVPIDHHPHPAPGFDAAWLFLQTLPGDEAHLATLHVGPTYPDTDLLRYESTYHLHRWTGEGNVVDHVTDTAWSWNADLVVVVSEGRHGFLDSVRGSTTERMVDKIRTPLLIVPADWGEEQKA